MLHIPLLLPLLGFPPMDKNLHDTETDSKALVTETNTNRGGGRNRIPQNREESGTRLKSRGRPTYFYCGKQGHFQKNCRHFRRDKRGADYAELKKISKKRGTTAIGTSKEELLLITEESKLHLVNDKQHGWSTPEHRTI